MPFRSRRSTRRASRRPSRRHTRKSTRKFSRRSRNRPTTGKESAIMRDRTFVKFNYTAITQANSGIADEAGNGFGMVPFSFASEPSMYVFTPNWNVTSGALGNYSLLPGNSLGLSGGFTYYSDNFEQELPTGVDKWASFYDKYICHGSAVDVTLCNCQQPGQLVVLPVTTSTVVGPIGTNGYTAITPFTSAGNVPPNWQHLTTFVALPDEQPYRKIKFVSATGGMDKVHVKHKMMTKKLYDVRSLRDDALNKADLTATVESQTFPTVNQWAWFIAYIPVNPPTDTAGGLVCTVQIKITYFCELMDRNAISYVSAL